MNMISTGTFLEEMDTSSKHSALVKKLVGAWEKKNSKVARAGGISLMALSLAACGDDDDTPFSQVDVDAAKAAGVAEGVASVDITSDNAAVAAAAKAEGAASVDITSDNADVAAAAKAEGVAEGVASVDITSDNAQAISDAISAASGGAFTDATALFNAYNGLANPSGESKALTTSTDTLVGTAGDDTFTGTASTFANADQIIDSSTTDNDTYNLTIGGAATPKVTNVETVNIDFNALTTGTINVGLMSGVTTLNVSRGDVVVGGSTLTGNKAVTLTEVSSAAIGKIVVSNASTVSVDQDFVAGGGVAGSIIEASATGDVTVTGAATVTVTGQGAGDSVDMAVLATAATGGNLAAENAKAVSITTDGIGATGAGNGVRVGALTGNIDITANNTLNIDVNNTGGTGVVNIASGASVLTEVTSLAGGGTITSGTTSTADSVVTVAAVDNSGVTINTGTGVSAASGKNITVNVTGTANSTDVATVSGTGYVTIANTNVDTLNLSGADGAVTFAINTGGATIAGSGANAVSLSGDESMFDGQTITGVTNVTLTGTGAQASALGKVSAEKFIVAYDSNSNATNDLEFAGGATVELTSDQTKLGFDVAATSANSNLKLIAGDEDTSSATVGTVTVGAMLTGAGAVAGTLELEAIESNFTATGVTLGSKQDMTITGDENVTLGTVAGGADTIVNASNLTGILNMTTTTLAPVVSGGSAADVIVVNGNDVHTISGNGGADDITVTDTAATSTIDGGDGADAITVTDTTAYVVVGGAGADTITMSAANEFDFVLVGGDGTDTLVTAGATTLRSADAETATVNGNAIDALGGGTNDVANANFAISGVEQLNITAGNAALSSSDLTGQTIAIIADGDTLSVVNDDAGGAMDLSGLSIKSGSTATLNYYGSTSGDQLTGGAAAENIEQTAGVDTIDGGAGTDTFTAIAAITETGSGASSGTVINMSNAAVTEATVVATNTGNLGGTITEVAANSYTYLYAADSAANSANVSGIMNVENIVGSTGADYIIGSSSNNSITGGQGADVLIGGAGSDTFVRNGNATTDGSDTISDFAVGASGDVIDLTTQLASVGGASVTGYASVANAGTSAATTGLIVVGGTSITGTTEAAVETLLGAGAANITLGTLGASFDAANENFYLLTDDGANSYLFLCDSGGTTAGFTAAEDTSTLMVTFSGIADCTTILASNFADFT
jgi:hypothetical protein